MLNKMDRICKMALWEARLSALRPYAEYLRLHTEEYHKLVLVSERGDDARDNGFAFFRYLNEKHPEVNSVYVIKRSSPDAGKVIRTGRMVEYGSRKHILMMLAADVLVSTHDMGYTPDMNTFHYLSLSKPLRGVKVCLQHGIMKDYIKWFTPPFFSPDIFCVSSKAEKKFMQSKERQGDNVRLTGLCRYDYLDNHEDAKILLIMPTWRQELSGATDSDFMNSEYYRRWQSLLESESFSRYLSENGMTAMFYPHYEFQKYLHLFHGGENVRLCSFDAFDVQELLEACGMLMTDYSSVFFDAAYMGKPVIFYQFDESGYFRSHYGRGYIDYGKYGTKCLSEKEAEEAVGSPERHDASRLFEYHDRCSCDRVFSEILDCMRNRKR